MRVVDLLNALQRFPGNAEVDAGTISVNGVPVVQDGNVTLAVVKGTKGTVAANVSGESSEVTSRRRRRE